MHGRNNLNQLRRIAAPLGPDHSSLDAVYFDAVALAFAKALALFGKALDPDRLLLRWEGLLQLHIQGAGEGNEAQFLHELAAVALPGDEVLALPETGRNFSAHDTKSFRIREDLLVHLDLYPLL